MPNAGRKKTFHSLIKLMNASALLYGKNNIGNIITGRKCIIPFWYQRRRGKANSNFSFDQLIRCCFTAKFALYLFPTGTKKICVWIYPLLSLAVATTAHVWVTSALPAHTCACRPSEVLGCGGWPWPHCAYCTAVVELWVTCMDAASPGCPELWHFYPRCHLESHTADSLVLGSECLPLDSYESRDKTEQPSSAHSYCYQPDSNKTGTLVGHNCVEIQYQALLWWLCLHDDPCLPTGLGTGDWAVRCPAHVQNNTPIYISSSVYSCL